MIKDLCALCVEPKDSCFFSQGMEVVYACVKYKNKDEEIVRLRKLNDFNTNIIKKLENELEEQNDKLLQS